MESYQSPHHPYMRPPPPPPPQAPPSMASDPHFPHHQPPPPPPNNSWFSGQFQYHASHSPSPPPPPPPPQQQTQWAPPPPPPPQYHQPYPAQPYPPPPPPPPRPSQAPPPPYAHQDWANANWSHHAGWEYSVNSNEEDWEAKARAWASARSAVENQHPQTLFTARQEEPSHYANQYAVESHYQDFQQTSIPTSEFQNYQGPVTPLRPPVHLQEPASISSYAPNAHISFSARDGTLGGGMSSAFPHHQGSTNSLVHQQEVPSSYSSVPGKEYGSHGHLLLPADSSSVALDHAQFAYGNHSMDQPLEFASRFSHENDAKLKLGYPDSSGSIRGTDPASVESSLQAWTAPAAPGMSYPPITPAFPSVPQHDLSVGVPPLPGQAGPMLGRGPVFDPAVPSVTTPFGLGAGSSLHPTTAFPVDAFGASLGSERPKAAVPNWLREEIIKNKATITSLVPKPFNDENQSNEDEIIVKSTAKDDQADSKSMDSARSTEEEDDDEDYEEAQRTAAINQEIKRVLTEVLLKVTDELFDEIATQVLSEDDLSVDAVINSENNAPTRKTSPPQPPVLAPKATAMLLNSVKAKESEERASGESSSGKRGNVLGLANYASDDDEEIQTSSVPKSDNADVSGADENGRRAPEAEDRRKNLIAAESDHNDGLVGDEGIIYRDPLASKMNERRITKDLDNDAQRASLGSSLLLGNKGDAVKSTDNGYEANVSRPDVPIEKENVKKSSKDDSLKGDAKRRDRHESKRSSSRRDNYKEGESVKDRESERDETYGRQDEKRQKKDKSEDYNISRERSRDQDNKHGEKARESDSRKRSLHHEDKDSKRERERDKKRSNNDDADKKRERTKDAKVDKSRHKSSSDGGRHRRRRSSSVDNRGKKNEDKIGVSDGSNGEVSDDSKRKVHSKKRNLSPSPVRSRRRQVSRSPHSKHSQRRHSPYSSLDDSRGRRSRSRSRSKSPSRRRR